MHKIANNSLKVDQIFSKLILVFAFRPSMCTPNFSQIGACIHKLKQFLQSVQNDEEEKEKKKQEILM